MLKDTENDIIVSAMQVAVFCAPGNDYNQYIITCYREGIKMKKGLSILLVAAALFGFYGGAANLNDVLACKDYWEKAGEESTANMNKLED